MTVRGASRAATKSATSREAFDVALVTVLVDERGDLRVGAVVHRDREAVVGDVAGQVLPHDRQAGEPDVTGLPRRHALFSGGVEQLGDVLGFLDLRQSTVELDHIGAGFAPACDFGVVDEALRARPQHGGSHCGDVVGRDVEGKSSEHECELEVLGVRKPPGATGLEELTVVEDGRVGVGLVGLEPAD